jgi:hypothetical protein
VLWYEQPEPTIYSKYLNPTWMVGMFVILGFGLLAFQCYLQFRIFRGGVSSLFLLQLATPLILILAPFIRIPIARLRATTIHYVVTNHQGFIVEKLKVKTLSSKYAASMELIEEKAGFQSLIFHRYSGWWGLIMVRIPVGFLGIAKAREVKQIISEYWHSG